MQQVNFDYDSAMFIEYELREGAQSAVTDEVLDDIEECFWENDYYDGLFALNYDGNKKIKLVVPYKKGKEDFWVGMAVGEFVAKVSERTQLDIWKTTVDEEEANNELQYNYTGHLEEA